MTVHHAQRLAAGLGLLAAIVLLTATAQHVAFGQTQPRALTIHSEHP